MQHPDERYYLLAAKWLNGTITPEERKEFSDWYNAGQDSPLDIPARFAANEEALRQRILQKVRAGRDRETNTVRLWKTPVARIAAAAVAAIAFGVAVFYFNGHSGGQTRPGGPLA